MVEWNGRTIQVLPPDLIGRSDAASHRVYTAFVSIRKTLEPGQVKADDAI